MNKDFVTLQILQITNGGILINLFIHGIFYLSIYLAFRFNNIFSFARQVVKY